MIEKVKDIIKEDIDIRKEIDNSISTMKKYFKTLSGDKLTKEMLLLFIEVRKCITRLQIASFTSINNIKEFEDIETAVELLERSLTNGKLIMKSMVKDYLNGQFADLVFKDLESRALVVTEDEIEKEIKYLYAKPVKGKKIIKKSKRS